MSQSRRKKVQSDINLMYFDVYGWHKSDVHQSILVNRCHEKVVANFHRIESKGLALFGKQESSCLIILMEGFAPYDCRLSVFWRDRKGVVGSSVAVHLGPSDELGATEIGPWPCKCIVMKYSEYAPSKCL